jgi:hypothetical protein
MSNNDRHKPMEFAKKAELYRLEYESGRMTFADIAKCMKCASIKLPLHAETHNWDIEGRRATKKALRDINKIEITKEILATLLKDIESNKEIRQKRRYNVVRQIKTIKVSDILNGGFMEQ